ncbi:MAG: glycosyltransferase family 4 protein [Acidothermaceae bacterium]
MADAATEQERGLRVALVLATSTGGVGRHVRALASGLSQAGHRVAVLGPAATNAKFGFVTAKTTSFRPVEIASGFRPLLDVRAALRLRRLTHGADIVHAHGLRAGVVAAAALLRIGRRSTRLRGLRRRSRPVLVVTLHNALLGNGFRHWLLELLMRRMACVADAVLVVSSDLKSALTASGITVERALISAVLPPPLRDACSVRSELGLDPSARLVVSIGRLHHQKGFDILVEASRSVHERVPDASIVVAGEGPQRADLERLITSIGGGVRLLGDRDDIADLVHAADVVVMPSRCEGWPLAAAEVLGAGRPLVATRVGGLPELVGDAGLLVEPEDSKALADALVRVLTGRPLASELATRARLRAAQLASDADVTRQISLCYQRVLAVPTPDGVR